jgi:outer membrane protein assembly factor BamB
MRLFTVMLLVLSLNACSVLKQGGEALVGFKNSLMGGEDNTAPPNELVKYEPEIQLEMLWKKSVGDGYDDQYVNLVPKVSAGKIIAADREGLVEARDAMDGTLLWKNETENPVAGGPGFGVGTVILGCSNAEVIALDFETGELIWKSKVSSEALSIPVVTNGIVIIRTVDGKMFALQEEDGQELWVYERNVPILSIRGESTPIIYDDYIIGGYANGKLVALQLEDGKHIWETSIAIPKGRSEIERLVDLGVNPVQTEGVVFISSYQSGTYAVLALDGDILWQNEDISSYTGMSYDWRYLYLTDSVSDIWQIDQRNGAALWKQKELHQRRLTAPVHYNNYVVVGDFEGYLHWLSDEDGRQLGRIRITDEAIIAQPIVVDDIVYAYATDGKLAAITIQAEQ